MKEVKDKKNICNCKEEVEPDLRLLDIEYRPDGYTDIYVKCKKCLIEGVVIPKGKLVGVDLEEGNVDNEALNKGVLFSSPGYYERCNENFPNITYCFEDRGGEDVIDNTKED